MDVFPNFFDSLSRDDQDSLIHLHSKLERQNFRFPDILDMIKSFCWRNDQSDSLRMLVCGIFWLPNGGLAVNFQQLKHILPKSSKSKSMLNSNLRRLGFAPVAPNSPIMDSLLISLPGSYGTFPGNLKQWSLFQMAPMTPEPFCSLLDNLKSIVEGNEQMKKAQCLSPEPQMVQATTFDEAKYKVDKFLQEREDFFFNDPFCLPPSFIFNEV